MDGKVSRWLDAMMALAFDRPPAPEGLALAKFSLGYPPALVNQLADLTMGIGRFVG